MYRLLGRTPASPKKSRRPARATANEAALKRDEPAREPVAGTAETTTVHTVFGRPVTSAGQRNAAPFGAAFCAFGGIVRFSSRFFSETATVGRRLWTAGYPERNLPAWSLRCSIGVAYQAADAGHPNTGRASSPPSRIISPANSIFTKMHAAKAHIGRASNPGNHWPHRVNPGREFNNGPDRRM